MVKAPIHHYYDHPDCALCDHNYRSTFRALTPDVPRLAVYDLDLILEYEGRIFGIVEWKKSRSEYPEYLIPAFEYIGLKKFGKMLRVRPYIVFEIVKKDKFVVIPVDRFERDREFKAIPSRHGQMAVFSPDESVVLSSGQFRGFICDEMRAACGHVGPV